MGGGRGRALWALALLLRAAPLASQPAAASAADEMFDWVISERLSDPPIGVMICHFGFSPHTVDFSRRVLFELKMPVHRAHVAFFRIPESYREAVEGLVREYPETAHAWESEEAFEGQCSVFVLSMEDPRFTVEDLRRVSRGPHSLVGHFHADCSKEQAHACRFFQSTWSMLATSEDTRCGRHFCMANLMDGFDDPLLSGIDCEEATSPYLPPSQISQWQQDWFVYRNFIHGTDLDRPAQLGGEARRGVFVDVGAFHPIHLSNTFFFERCLGWRGICAEPTPQWEPYFGAYRPSCTLVPHCVWSEPRNVTMSFQKDPIETYIQDEGLGANTGGASGAVLIDGSGKQGPAFTTTCRTLEDILTSAGLQKPAVIDYMSVDAEAAEVEIFRVFPFDKFDVSVISVEVQAKNYYELDVIFSTAGYAKLAVLGGDHVYAKMRRGLTLPDGATDWHKTLARNFHAHGKPQTITMGGSQR